MGWGWQGCGARAVLELGDADDERLERVVVQVVLRPRCEQQLPRGRRKRDAAKWPSYRHERQEGGATMLGGGLGASGTGIKGKRSVEAKRQGREAGNDEFATKERHPHAVGGNSS